MFTISPSVLGKYFVLNKCDKYIVYHSLDIENVIWARKDNGTLVFHPPPLFGDDLTKCKSDAELIKGSFLWKLEEEQKEGIKNENENGNEIIKTFKTVKKSWRVISPTLNEILTECFQGNAPSAPVTVEDSISHRAFYLDQNSTPQTSLLYGTHIKCKVNNNNNESENCVIVSKIPFPTSATQDRHIRTGLAWERYILDQLKGLCGENNEGKWSLEMGGADENRDKSAETRTTEERLLSLLTSTIAPGHTKVLYQPALVAGPSFYRMYGLADSVDSEFDETKLTIKVPKCYPDFMLLEGSDSGKTRVSIADAKGSQNVSSSHKVQIAFYSLILRSIVEEHGLGDRVEISSTGYVWLRPRDFEVSFGESGDVGHRLCYKDSPERIREALKPFSIEGPEAFVQGVLRNIHRKLATVKRGRGRRSGDIEDLARFGTHCKYCTYGPICEEELERKRCPEVYSGISPSDARLIEAVTQGEGGEKGSGEALERAIESAEDPEVEMRLRHAKAVLDAATKGTPVLGGSGSDTFTLGEDVSVFLAVATDKPSRKVCCWGVKAFFRNEKGVEVASKLAKSGMFALEGMDYRDKGGYSCVAFGVSAGDVPPWGPTVDSESLCKGLVSHLHALFNAVATHNIAREKELRKTKTAGNTYDDPSLLGATLFVADTDQADVLRSILWDSLRTDKSAEAEDLLWAMYGNEGSMIYAPSVRSYLNYRRPHLVRVLPEMYRLYNLGSRSVGRNSRNGGCSILEEWARAFGVISNSSPMKAPIGAERIAECWSSDGAWTQEMQRSALTGTLSAMEGVVTAARTTIAAAPEVSARVPLRAMRFGWMVRIRDKGKGKGTGELSQSRRECIFMNQYESYTDYADKYALRTLRSIQEHLRCGSMYLLERCEETISKEGKKGRKTKNPTLFYISEAAQHGLETKRDRTFVWWLIPYDTQTQEAETQIMRTLEEFKEFYLNFYTEKSSFISIPTFSRVLIDAEEPFLYGSDATRPILRIKYFLKGKEFDMGCTHYILTPSPFNVNAPRMDSSLRSTSGDALSSELGGRASFEEIVSDPVRWATSPFESDASSALRERALGILAEGDFRLTRSQRAAVENVLNTHLQLLWGPPGTGKTQVLGVLVTVLARAAAELQQPFRVLVTALSHSNINGLLSRICAVRGTAPVPAVGRFDITTKALCDWAPEGCDVTSSKASKKADRVQQKLDWIEANPICVVGGTVWQFMSELLSPEDFCALGAPFDMLLWDDASQSKTEDLSVYAPLLSRGGGRLVLAGDPLQLPPIIRGTYAAPSTIGLFRRADAEPVADITTVVPFVTKSVYECIEGRAGAAVDVLRSALLENWRMNNEISTFLQSTLYNAIDYRAARADDENSHIPMPDLDAFDSARIPPAVFAPEKSICVLCVQHQRRFAAEMHPEAPLVASIVRALCAALHVDVGSRDVWEKLIFLICPHHSQIAAVSHALNEPAAHPLTVERAQGLERDIVIADYALFNTDVIRGELEFLFNANRMNVCLSRARKKCIFIVSDAILGNTGGGFDILSNPNVERGYLFLNRIIKHAKEHDAFIKV